ncbi:hypothetical protein LCGC14_2010220 [marine sediment metagenome]|uniref:Uncharacterized protein n=1 Tax=marine sediment metagenome TaxID=412755 RepID=A0A0F9F0R3_9ZZZZ
MSAATATVVRSPEHKAASDASKKAFTIKVEKGIMTITCPVIERESTTGKTIIVANGKKQFAYVSKDHGDQIVNAQINAYFYNPDFVA